MRAAWGDAGLVALAMALAVGRGFPVAKAGLGFVRERGLAGVAGRQVTVAHGALAAVRVAVRAIVA